MFFGSSMEEDKPRQLQQHQQMSQSDEVDCAGKDGKSCKEDRRSAGDGLTIEVTKQRRGRPPGSKNKQKPLAVVTREAEPAAALQPHVFEIPGGHDLVYSLGQFSRRRNLGLCVLSGTGAVANVTLRHPAHLGAGAPPSGAPAPAATVLRGRFEILSISATFLPPTMAAVLSASVDGLAIALAGPQGQIIRGRVAGQLVTAGTVVVVAAVFSSPTFHRLPEEEVSVSGADWEEDLEEMREQNVCKQRQEGHEHQRRRQGPTATVQEPSGGMTINYRGKVASDKIIWAPRARPPPPSY